MKKGSFNSLHVSMMADGYRESTPEFHRHVDSVSNALPVVEHLRFIRKVTQVILTDRRPSSAQGCIGEHLYGRHGVTEIILPIHDDVSGFIGGMPASKWTLPMHVAVLIKDYDIKQDEIYVEVNRVKALERMNIKGPGKQRRMQHGDEVTCVVKMDKGDVYVCYVLGNEYELPKNHPLYPQPFRTSINNALRVIVDKSNGRTVLLPTKHVRKTSTLREN